MVRSPSLCKPLLDVTTAGAQQGYSIQKALTLVQNNPRLANGTQHGLPLLLPADASRALKSTDEEKTSDRKKRFVLFRSSVGNQAHVGDRLVLQPFTEGGLFTR
jgi:hypothetical protein